MSDKILYIDSRPIAAPAISLEQYYKRRIQRRRRVAKRYARRLPLFAVDVMQAEFPGYTHDEFVGDISRKSRKSVSMRICKIPRFDWCYIYKNHPDIFYSCRFRAKTKAIFFIRLPKSEIELVCTIRARWLGDYGYSRLTTGALIKLLRGPIKDLIQHPAVLIAEQKKEL